MVLVRRYRAGSIVSSARQMGFSIAASVTATMIVAAWQENSRGAEPRPTPALTSGGKFAARLDGGELRPAEPADAEGPVARPIESHLVSLLSALPPLGFPGIGEGSTEGEQAGKPAPPQKAAAALHAAAARRHQSAIRVATPPKRSDFLASPTAVGTAEEQPEGVADGAIATLRTTTSAAYRHAVGYIGSVWDQLVLSSF